MRADGVLGLEEKHWTTLSEVCAFSTLASFFSPCQLATRTHSAAAGIVVQELNMDVSKLQCEARMSSFFPHRVWKAFHHISTYFNVWQFFNVGNVSHVNYIQVLNHNLLSFELDLEWKNCHTRCSEPEFRACLWESSQGVSDNLHVPSGYLT